MKYIYSILILTVLAYAIGLNVTTISITDTFIQHLKATAVGAGIILFVMLFALATYFVIKPSKNDNTN